MKRRGREKERRVWNTHYEHWPNQSKERATDVRAFDLSEGVMCLEEEEEEQEEEGRGEKQKKGEERKPKTEADEMGRRYREEGEKERRLTGR